MEKEQGVQYHPRYYARKEKTEQVMLSLVVFVQLVSLLVALYYYNVWYAVTKIGASAVVSSLLCGFSQGLLQLIVHRRFDASSLLKFYCWGIINGFWTVSFLCLLF